LTRVRLLPVLALAALLAAAPLAAALGASTAVLRVRGHDGLGVETHLPAITGAGVTVAVLDTGVDVEHPTFAGAFLAGLDVSSPCSNPVSDPAGTDATCYAARDVSTAPDDTNGHGTHVASILLGRGDAAGGVPKGVAPGAKLVVVKIAPSLASLESGGLLRGLKWIEEFNAGRTRFGQPTGAERVRVVSVSFSTHAPGSTSSPEAQAIDRLSAAGVAVVVAAGNCGPAPSSADRQLCGGDTGSNRVGNPGMACAAITVGAVDDGGSKDRADATLAGFSSRGPGGASTCPGAIKPDVVAPGVAITGASHDAVPGAARGARESSGTSQATPHVAGILALMLQANASLAPADLKRLLASTATLPDGSRPPNPRPDWGHGLVDAFAAVRAAMGGNKPPRVSLVTDAAHGSVPVGTRVVFEASGSTDDLGIASIAWRFDDGVRASGPRANRTFDTPGARSVEVAVTDLEGAVARANATIRVIAPDRTTDEPPVARLTFEPSAVVVGEPVVFDGRASTDDVGVVEWSWDVHDDGTVDARGERVRWTGFGEPSVVVVRLTVRDTLGQAATAVGTLLVERAPVEDPAPATPSAPRDATPPTLSIVSPEDGARRLEGEILVSWRAGDDAVRVVVWLDDVAVHETDRGGAGRVALRASAGPHTLLLKAWDEAGNAAIARASFSAYAAEPLEPADAGEPDVEPAPAPRGVPGPALLAIALGLAAAARLTRRR